MEKQAQHSKAAQIQDGKMITVSEYLLLVLNMRVRQEAIFSKGTAHRVLEFLEG